MSDPLPPMSERERNLIEKTSAELRRKQDRAQQLGMLAELDASARQSARPTLISRRGDEITPERIDWLWPGRIARGKLTVVAGHPGTGKSQITSSIVATVTRGGRWPVDQTCAPLGSTVILSAEDDAADTIIPRLIAAGADLSKLHVVDAVRALTPDGIPDRRGVDLGKDVLALELLLAHIGDVALIVIDPITAYLGRADSHVNAEVRGLLMPLAQLAERSRAAIIAVTHLRKSAGSEALLAVIGSLGFVAAARAAYLVVKDAQDPQRRLWLPAKNNIAPDVCGLAYRIVSCTIANDIETSRIEWEPDPVKITADAALAAHPDTDDMRSDRDAAADWLREVLSAGPMLARDVQNEAKAAGHSWATIRRAKDAIGVCVRREGFGKDGAWHWTLPAASTSSDTIDAIAAHKKNMSTYAFYGDVEHLCAPIDAHEESIECIDAHLFVPEHLEQVCRRCDGEGCRWCE